MDETQTPQLPRASASKAAALRTLPSPEELGLTTPGVSRPAQADWATVHGELDRHGVHSLHIEKLASGGCRLICFIPGRRPDLNHRIEVTAATQAEAAAAVLAKLSQRAAKE